MDGVTDQSAVVREAQTRHQHCETREADARVRWRDDLRFRNADHQNRWQWPESVWNARNPAVGAPRPCLTINKTRQHCLQIENDARQRAMGVKVNAVGVGATAEAADAIEGIVRHIEYQSNAQQNAYQKAIEHQVGSGLGWVHIETDYAAGETMDQELYIRSVLDPLTVWSDPDCQEPDHSDQRWAMIGSDLPRDEFERKYPGHKDVEGAEPLDTREPFADWSTRDTVRVVKYYRLVEQADTLWAVPAMGDVPGGMVRESAMPEGMPDAAKAAGWPQRGVTDRRVEWFLIAGQVVLEHGDTVFDHIPLVPFIGEETLIEGKLDRRGHVRALVDAQRMYNYNRSAEVEFGALQTKVPWVTPLESIEGLEAYWNTANTQNHAYLPYKLTDGNGTPLPAKPERINPPAASAVFAEGAQAAAQDMMLVSGQYEAQMGERSNERTGIAIQERARQGDTATYHFTDNQARALRLIGRILVGAIPKVYDTQRAVQILGQDGKRTAAVIDPQLDTAHQQTPDPSGRGDTILAVNPTIGRYDVEADVGPSYGTRRQEAFNALSQILAADKSLMPIIGDLVMDAADFPLASEAAERLLRLVPPQALGQGDDPKLAAAQQQLQQMGQHLSAALQQVADLKRAQGDQSGKLAIDAQRVEIDRERAHTDRMAAIGNIDPDMLRPILRALVIEAMHEQQGGGAPLGLTAEIPHPNAPTGDQQAALARMPSTNTPGGEIRDPVPSAGDVQ